MLPSWKTEMLSLPELTTKARLLTESTAMAPGMVTFVGVAGGVQLAKQTGPRPLWAVPGVRVAGGCKGGRAGGGVAFVSLEILKMRGIKDGADGKRTVEIRCVAPLRQSANEHGPGIAGIEIVRRGRRNGDNVGSASGAGDGYAE